MYKKLAPQRQTQISQQKHAGDVRAKVWINDKGRKEGKNKRESRDERYFQPMRS